MRIVFTGGGTAGHVNPAIAIADAVRRRYPDSEIFFVGTPKGMENKLVADAGYPIWHIDVGGLERRVSLKNIGVIIKTARSLSAARGLLKELRPDAVIGTGGYVCYPTVREAAKMGVFTALHESNAVAGLAVRMLSDRVDKVYINFDDAKNELKHPERAVTVGNPVREEVTRLERNSARNLLGLGAPIPGREAEFAGEGTPLGSYRHVIVSFGGSLGAETVNREALKLMNGYCRNHPEALMIHACGKSGYPEFMRRANELGVTKLKNVIINEFIRKLPIWLSASDIVICRSGANTVSELAAIGRASVMIPSPNVTGDHQYRNAKVMGDIGGAFVVRENSEEIEKIEELVATVLGDRRLRENMEICASKLAPKENAAEVIAADIAEAVLRR
ncbi:MAG: UDP-N-acetylglucosamine--N-acetylmuramyl-(pentapeptide) pyrophosphoryl-undecaprenol N-acetylglucosamine transferase [Clostridia bacterium]|nr:UDP-N-acetylglucosamine--N-acetylmuramyl-(pentapeptide) pyrophosphoryl-undecaprenol N-acetylglucosamine transferase [Clostridia bacterium]